MHLNPKGFELFSDKISGFMFLKRQFWVAVQIMTPLAHILSLICDCVMDRHDNPL
jgi:hypothetical protein